MDINKFFTRIGFEGTPKNDYETLAQIQEKFLLNVPFENLDIHFGPTKLAVCPDKAYDKIVNHGRGGFCYECNSLLYAVLKEMGYGVDMLSCRMVDGPLPDPDFSHMVLRVKLDQDYLVDVGNGRSYRRPIRADGANQLSIPEGFSYRVGPHLEGHAMYFCTPQQSWTPRYFFYTEPRELQQFEERCNWYQTSPHSLFLKGPLVTMATKEGRKFLLKNEFVVVTHGKEDRTPVKDGEEFLELLKEHFRYPVQEISRSGTAA